MLLSLVPHVTLCLEGELRGLVGLTTTAIATGRDGGQRGQGRHREREPFAEYDEEYALWYVCLSVLFLLAEGALCPFAVVAYF